MPTGEDDQDEDMEEVTLLKVGMGDDEDEEDEEDEDDDEEGNDFDTMILLDGRRLTINPVDISTAICWSPTATLHVIKADDDRFYDLIVKHKLHDQEIRARWV